MIEGMLQTIELKDGRDANVELLARYRGFLSYMECNHSRMFNEACRKVHQEEWADLSIFDKMRAQKNLDVASFKIKKANGEVGEARTNALWGNHLEEYFYPDYRAELHVSQIGVAIQLCTEPTVLSRIFQSVASGRPLSYKVINPVKKGAEPHSCEYMWIGSSMTNVYEWNIII